MNNQVLQQVKEALEKATPGPWKWITDGICLFPESGHDYGDAIMFIQKSSGPSKEDANLIANSPTWLHQLVTELEEAHKKLENMIDKEKLVEWIKVEIELSQGSDSVLKRDTWAFQQVRQAIRSGRFDVKEGLE